MLCSRLFRLMEFGVVDSPLGSLKDFLRTDSFETNEINKPSKSRLKWRIFARLFRIRSCVMRTTLHPVSSILWSSDTDSMGETVTSSSTGDHDYTPFKSHWTNYSLSALKLATNNFSPGIFQWPGISFFFCPILI